MMRQLPSSRILSSSSFGRPALRSSCVHPVHHRKLDRSPFFFPITASALFQFLARTFRWPDGPRNHEAQDAVAPEEFGVWKESGTAPACAGNHEEQEISRSRVSFSPRSVRATASPGGLGVRCTDPNITIGSSPADGVAEPLSGGTMNNGVERPPRTAFLHMQLPVSISAGNGVYVVGPPARGRSRIAPSKKFR